MGNRQDDVGYDLAAELPRPRRWPWVVGALVVCVLLAGAVVAAVTGRLLPYQADREVLTGTPFVIRAQAGVPPEEEDRVRTGLVAVHTSLEDHGGGMDRSVEVRLTWSQGCGPLLGPSSVAPAWAEDGLLCLNAAHPGWRRQVERHEWYPAYVAAHEHVHLWQEALGCHVDGDAHEWLWLYEGMADHLAFEAIESAGVLASAQTVARIREVGGLDPALGSLGDHEERSAAAAHAYGLYHLAARELAASSPGPQAFADFCVATGRGAPWEQALSDAFGTSRDELYAAVDQRRSAVTDAG